jgi:hypothetical protein
MQTQAAIISFCPDLTDPDAKSTPIFRVVALDQGLTVTYLKSLAEIRELSGDNVLTVDLIQHYPWFLYDLYREMSADRFLERLLASSRHSSLFVERLEPC